MGVFFYPGVAASSPFCTACEDHSPPPLASEGSEEASSEGIPINSQPGTIMAIAKNFRKYAEALLYQLELPLNGFERTIQNLRGAVLACYRRSILAGTWDKAKFLPKTPRRPVRAWPARAVPGAWFWHQGRLDLDADLFEIF